jgi:hypothetical protein
LGLLPFSVTLLDAVPSREEFLRTIALLGLQPWQTSIKLQRLLVAFDLATSASMWRLISSTMGGLLPSRKLRPPLSVGAYTWCEGSIFRSSGVRCGQFGPSARQAIATVIAV